MSKTKNPTDKLAAYSLLDFETKWIIQSFFEHAASVDMVNQTADFNDYNYRYVEEYGGIRMPRFSRPRHEIAGLYHEFTGFQLPGVGQDPKFENGTDAPWFNMTFVLDPSINMSGTDPGEDLEPMPYNSTLWFNGSAIALDAPFLSLPANQSDCDWFSYVGPCLCYRDALLTTDFREDNNANLICISEEGYVWGFSSIMMLVGIILEVCWMLGCFGMWLDVHINSTLFRMNRPSSGRVRNILDVAGAIQRDLGEDTGAYKDGELKKALAKCPPVGFEVDGSGKVDRIAIVSMPGVRRRRSRVRIESSRLYA